MDEFDVTHSWALNRISTPPDRVAFVRLGRYCLRRIPALRTANPLKHPATVVKYKTHPVHDSKNRVAHSVLSSRLTSVLIASSANSDPPPPPIMWHNPALHLSNAALSYSLLPAHLRLFCRGQEFQAPLAAVLAFIATAEAGNIFQAASQQGLRAM